MTLEEAMEKILAQQDTIKELEGKVQNQKTELETKEKDISERDNQITSLKESNMRYFEKLAMQEVEEPKNEKSKEQEEKPVTIDDILNDWE